MANATKASKVPITTEQVCNHLSRITKSGNKASIQFLIRRKDDILKIWYLLEPTIEQQLQMIWGEIHRNEAAE